MNTTDNKAKEVKQIVQLNQKAVSLGLEKGAFGGDILLTNQITQATIALGGIGEEFAQLLQENETLKAQLESYHENDKKQVMAKVD